MAASPSGIVASRTGDTRKDVRDVGPPEAGGRLAVPTLEALFVLRLFAILDSANPLLV
jgi:hypothetical protein